MNEGGEKSTKRTKMKRRDRMTETLSLWVAGTGHLAERSFIGSIYPVFSLQWRNHSRGSSWPFWLMADEINCDQRGSTEAWQLCGYSLFDSVAGKVEALTYWKSNPCHCDDRNVCKVYCCGASAILEFASYEICCGIL